MNAREISLKCGDIIKMDSRLAQCAIRNPDDKATQPKSFTFDGAFDIDSTTEQIYADIGFPLVEVITLIFITLISIVLLDLFNENLIFLFK